MWFVRHNYHKSGLDPSIGLRYVNAVAALVPGAKVVDRSEEGVKGLKVVVGSREITLADVLPRSSDWLVAIRQAMAETEAAGAAKTSSE